MACREILDMDQLQVLAHTWKVKHPYQASSATLDLEGVQ